MKKITLFFAGLLLLSSCSLFGNTPSTVNNTNISPITVSKEGIIRSKDISLQTPGTHQLEMSDGKFLAIESKVVSLADYIDQQVILEGVLRKINNVDVLDVASVTLIPSTNQNGNTNRTQSTMLQYTGPLPFSFFYSSLFEITSPSPTELNLLLQDKTVDVTNKDDPIITINAVLDKPVNLKAWVKETLGKDSVTIIVGNRTGERVVNTTDNNITIYVLVDQLYEIRFAAPGGKDETMLKNKFYDMIASFLWTTEANTNANTALPPVNTNKNSVVNTNKNAVVKPNNTNSMISTPIGNDLQKQVISYLKENLNLLKPADDAITGIVTPTKFEFASPNYVYVEYTDGMNKRKILFKYMDDNGLIKATQIAYFVPGTTKDWDLQSGTNEAATSSRDIYDTTGTKTVSVNEGMRLYENKVLKYGIQYPANWYYGGSAPAEAGAIHQVNFADQPLDSNPAKISVLVFKGTLASLGITNPTIAEGGKYTVYVEHDGRVYKITGASDQSATITKMSGTIVTIP